MGSVSAGEDHPMHALASALGEVEYPPPPADSGLRIGLMVLPCVALVVVSIAWPPSATLLLTFVGAFASIQLADPYKRWVKALDDQLAEAREEQRSALDLWIQQYRMQTSPTWYQGMRPVGYSPAALARARRRFLRVSRAWRASFIDMSARQVGPDGSVIGAPAFFAGAYRRGTTFRWNEYVADGRSVRARVWRGLVGGAWAGLLSLHERALASPAADRIRSRCAERTLARVGRELIRATKDRNGDDVVVSFANRLGFAYSPPTVPERWVWRERIAPVPPRPSPFGAPDDTTPGSETRSSG